MDLREYMVELNTIFAQNSVEKIRLCYNVSKCAFMHRLNRKEVEQ